MEILRYIVALALVLGLLMLLALLLRRLGSYGGLPQAEESSASQNDDAQHNMNSAFRPAWRKSLWSIALPWQRQSQRGRRLKHIETVALDQRRRLVLMDYQGEEILLLLGPQGDLQITLPHSQLANPAKSKFQKMLTATPHLAEEHFPDNKDNHHGP